MVFVYYVEANNTPSAMDCQQGAKQTLKRGKGRKRGLKLRSTREQDEKRTLYPWNPIALPFLGPELTAVSGLELLGMRLWCASLSPSRLHQQRLQMHAGKIIIKFKKQATEEDKNPCPSRVGPGAAANPGVTATNGCNRASG